jgi:hypothetical protein
MAPSRFNDAFQKLAQAEQQFLACEFLAPAIGHGEVQVRIAGVVTRLRVSPADFRGLGVFRPKSHREAVLVRPATLAQRRAYLALFPLVRLILVTRDAGGQWLAVAAHRGDQRFQLDGLAPVQMVEEAQQFDVIRARFDGRTFWFDSREPARDPATAAYLRQQAAKKIDPRQLDRPGLTPEERLAYTITVAPQASGTPADRDGDGSRLRAALAQAGAELVEYLERGDSFRVTFRIGGEQHVSAVRKDDLSVQVAGICLSGEDQQFDLTSLVGVLREAAGDVPRVGEGGMQEEHYWRVHPPQDR